MGAIIMCRSQMAPGESPRRFATTRWSLVLALREGGAQESEAALASLCETYWYPVYAFIRRSGKDADTARDLTQEFFALVLEKHFFRDARQERGRFRSFLLASVRHFLANEYDRRMAQKRGGAHAHQPLEFDDGERRYSREPADGTTPEHVYERRWALTALETALARVSAKYATADKPRLFTRLRPFITGDEPPSYAELAGELGTSAGALRVAVHRLRQQFATALRDVIGETLADADEVQDELRYLLAVVSRPAR